MHKEILISGFIFVLSGVLLFAYAPDSLSAAFVVLMCALVTVGFVAGIVPIVKYNSAFIMANKNIERARKTQTDDIWLAVGQIEVFFFNNDLDKKFKEYQVNVAKLKKKGSVILPDIETVIDEDYIFVKTWRSVVSQIPNALTGFGILGTFLGLLFGINGISLATREVIINSISTLLDGIRLAFYSSIAGVIMSLIFNFIYSFMCNLTIRNMDLFFHNFHRYILPPEEDQIKYSEVEYRNRVLNQLDKLSDLDKLDQLNKLDKLDKIKESSSIEKIGKRLFK